jgi:hypothetical protein
MAATAGVGVRLEQPLRTARLKRRLAQKVAQDMRGKRDIDNSGARTTGNYGDYGDIFKARLSLFRGF